MDAISTLTHGVYVLGAVDKGKNYGAVVDAVAWQASEPMIISVSCMNTGATKQAVDESGRFSLSVLGENCPASVISGFGYRSSRNVDKWSAVSYVMHEGLPTLSECLGWLVCEVADKKVFPSHTVFFGKVIESASFEKKELPLTYHFYREKMRTNINNKKEEVAMSEPKEVWECIVCGYVYDGEVPFEELPEDWVCPLCGVDKTHFVKKTV